MSENESERIDGFALKDVGRTKAFCDLQTRYPCMGLEAGEITV